MKSAAGPGGQRAFRTLPSYASAHAHSLTSEGVSVICSFSPADCILSKSEGVLDFDLTVKN